VTGLCGLLTVIAVWLGSARPPRAGRLVRLIHPTGRTGAPEADVPEADVPEANLLDVDVPEADGDARLLRPAVRRTAAVVCLFAGVVTIGGPAGLIAGAVAGSAAMLVNPTVSRREEISPDDVPMVLDLLGGCLAAGVTWPDALEATARASGAVAGAACAQVAAALRSGAPAEEAFSGWLGVPALAPAARGALRSARSGAAAADDLHRTAARLRAQRRSETQHRVRRASVWLVVPLGLCFLPAFVLLSVVPLVIGLIPALR
jgi:Flp pilus assembly protein TadB